MINVVPRDSILKGKVLSPFALGVATANFQYLSLGEDGLGIVDAARDFRMLPKVVVLAMGRVETSIRTRFMKRPAQMPPTLTRNDAGNGRVPDMKSHCQGIGRFAIGISLTNLKHLLRRQFGLAILFALARMTMTDLVLLVREMHVPAQVVKAVISIVAIIVARFHAWRARADKGSQDKPMHQPRFAVCIPGKHDMERMGRASTTSRSQQVWLIIQFAMLNAISLPRAHIAKVTDIIARIVQNRFPNLFHRSYSFHLGLTASIP